MPRVKLFSEEETLTKALELFWQKGYEATSLSDLTNRLGIGKGSFYDTFGSKKELFNRSLELYRQNGFDTLEAILAEKSNPVEGIRYFLNKHTELMLSDPSFKGCFIANSTTELSDDALIQEYLNEHNQIIRAKLVDYLKKGNFSLDLDTLADTILTQLTGISVMSRIIKDKNRFKKSNELFMRLIAN